MAQKIVARIGRSSELPVLIIGEIGFDTDTLVARFGDGSPNAPRVMTDKSSGLFEYLNIDYVKYPEIQMVSGGTVDGVDLSELNSANGLIVRTGNNSWGHRQLTNSDGYLTVLNGDGRSGNPVINAGQALISFLSNTALVAVSHDETLTGNGSVSLPLSVVTATTSLKGVLELATADEVIAGIDASISVSPATLVARTATASRTGLIALATAAEVNAGTDQFKAVTPATLSSYFRPLVTKINDMIGVVVSYAGVNPPTGWLICNGQPVSRTGYAQLFAILGTFWGTGDGSTTFNLPDFRGEFLRGLDNGRGIDIGRQFGSFQADEFRSHTHGYSKIDIIGNGERDNNTQAGETYIPTQTDAAGGVETRPRNIALNFIIKVI
jgi:microcystin-dependent protein